MCQNAKVQYFQRNFHCYQRIDLPVKKDPLLIYGYNSDLLYLFNMLFEYVLKFISVH